MRALVTGALGFVGRHLVEHLRAEGDEVVSLDHHGPDPVDITDPVAIRGRRRGGPPRRRLPPRRLGGCGRILDPSRRGAAAQRRGHPARPRGLPRGRRARVLSVASADVYGIVSEADLPLTEDSPIRPTSPYAASKVAADAVALQAFLGHGLGVIRVRPFNHIGPGQSEHFVAPAIAARIAQAERDGVDTIGVGNLTPRRDLTDVRDVVRAYRMLIERGAPGEAYNVCTGRDLAVQELADRLVALATRRSRSSPTRPATTCRPARAPRRRHQAASRNRVGARDPHRADPLGPARRPARPCAQR